MIELTQIVFCLICPTIFPAHQKDCYKYDQGYTWQVFQSYLIKLTHIHHRMVPLPSCFGGLELGVILL